MLFELKKGAQLEDIRALVDAARAERSQLEKLEKNSKGLSEQLSMFDQNTS